MRLARLTGLAAIVLTLLAAPLAVEAQEVEVTQGGVVLAFTKELEVTAGGVVAAIADSAELRQSWTQMVIARESVNLGQGGGRAG
jgi:hypothetical protein